MFTLQPLVTHQLTDRRCLQSRCTTERETTRQSEDLWLVSWDCCLYVRAVFTSWDGVDEADETW